MGWRLEARALEQTVVARRKTRRKCACALPWMYARSRESNGLAISTVLRTPAIGELYEMRLVRKSITSCGRHHREDRIRAHVQLCWLALLLSADLRTQQPVVTRLSCGQLAFAQVSRKNHEAVCS